MLNLFSNEVLSESLEVFWYFELDILSCQRPILHRSRFYTSHLIIDQLITNLYKE